MSLQCQAVLLGHFTPDEIVDALKATTGGLIIARTTHRDSYKLIELSGSHPTEVFHLFLNSSVADDYSDVTKEPSTLVSVQFSPKSSEIVKRLVERAGGFFRRTEHEQWERIRPMAA